MWLAGPCGWEQGRRLAWDHGRMGPSVRFRTVASRVIAASVIAVCAVAAAQAFLTGGWPGGLQATGVVAVVAVAAWAVFWHPMVEVSDGGITVRNVLRTIHVPWPSLVAVDSHWSLTLETTGPTVSSWAVPATSGMAARARPFRAAAPNMAGESTAALATQSATADAVALVIGERLASLKAAGLLAGPRSDITPSAVWNVPVAAATASAVVLLALTRLIA